MGTAVIRLARVEDLEVLCQLYVTFHEFHVLGVPGRLLSLGEPDAFDCSKLVENLRKIMDDGNAALFVAEEANHLVGLAEAYLRQDEPDPATVTRLYGHLQSLMVLESFRQRGLGAQLVEAAEQWVREKGATEMRLDTWEFAAGPLRFYEKLGYHTLRRTLVKNFSQEAQCQCRNLL